MNASPAIQQDYLADLGMNSEQLALLAHTPHLADAVAELAAHDEHQAALTLLARHMAKTYAIGWAAACLKWVGVGDGDIEAVACVDDWLGGQEEAARRRAAELAAEREYATAGAWLAAAAGWSGGSLAPDGEAEVPPPDYLYALAVAGAIGMAIAADPERYAARFEVCVARAMELVAS